MVVIAENKTILDRKIKPNTIYRHYKNKGYFIHDVFRHTETGEYYVAYVALYGDCLKHTRPLEMFLSKVPEEDQHKNVTGQTYRFMHKVELLALNEE